MERNRLGLAVRPVGLESGRLAAAVHVALSHGCVPWLRIARLRRPRRDCLGGRLRSIQRRRAPPAPPPPAPPRASPLGPCRAPEMRRPGPVPIDPWGSSQLPPLGAQLHTRFSETPQPKPTFFFSPSTFIFHGSC